MSRFSPQRALTVGLILSFLGIFPASAADHSSIWHAVEAKSHWSTGPMPNGFQLAITLTLSDDRMIYHSANTTAGLVVPPLDFTAKLDGTVTPVVGQTRFNQISVRRLEDGVLEVLEMKDGDVIVGSFWTFNPDGASFVRRGVGKGADGKSKAFEEFFQRG